MVKLKDIAEKAGVTISTVSAALNGRGNMKDETRELLLQTAKEMGYEPNQAARQLRNKPAVDVALVINDKFRNLRRGGTYLAHISEFLALCARGGLSSRIEFFDNDNKEDSIPDVLKDNVASGVIHVGYVTAGIKNFLAGHPDYPLVVFGEPGNFSVRSSLEKGAYQAIQYLAALGHKDIMASFGPIKYDYHHQIYDGTMKAVQDFGLNRLGDEFKFEHQANDDEKNFLRLTHERCRDILTLKPRPTAVFCSGAIPGCAYISVANQLGIRIPEELSIVTVGVINDGSGSYPQLTSIENNFNGMYSAALFILQQLRNGRQPIQKEVWVDPMLVIQESTAAPGKEKDQYHESK